MALSPRTLRPSSNWTPKSISGLALWLDASDSQSLYTTDAGAVTPVTLPTDISGCVGWWDASDAATLFAADTGSTLATTTVGRWANKVAGGSDKDLLQTDSTKRPTITSNYIGGMQSLVFDGTNDALLRSFTLDATCHLFVVMKWPASYSANVRATDGYAQNTMSIVRTSNTAFTVYGSASLSLTGSGNALSPQIVEVCKNGTSSRLCVNGAGQSFGDLSAEAPNGLTIGAYGLGTAAFDNVGFAEVIAFSDPLSVADAARVSAYLAAKWGITGVHRSASQEIAAVSSPTELAGCAGWWDCSRTDKMFNATTGGSLVSDGGAVLRLEDLSGNGKHLVQATSASAPSRQDGAKNGLPALNFAGTKALAAGAAGDWNFLHNTQGGTVIAVIKPFDTADPNTFAYGVATNIGGATNGIGWSSFFDDRVSYPRNNHVSQSVTAGVSGQTVVSQEQNNAIPSANDFSLLSFTPFAGSSTTAGRGGMYVSGTATGNANSSTLAPSASNSNHALTVGTAGGNSIAGLAELIVYNTVLSAVDRARVEKYLQQKWATPTVPDPTPPVGYWADKSGNSRHLTQSLSASRPLLLTNGVSSKPALNFDGTDDTIWRQPGLTSDDLSILIVHQTSFMSGGVTYEFTHSGDTTNTQAGNLTGFTNVAGLQVSATGAANYMSDVTRAFASVDIQGRSGAAGDITANVPAIGTQCVSYSATASAIRKQSWTNGKGMPNNTRFNCGGWSAITLGARRNSLAAGGINSPTVFLSGRIAEVIAYSRYISDSDRRRLELYLARKWNVTLAGAPTVSHPEAQDWIDRVYGAGGSVSTLQAAAVNTFCLAIDDAGIRDKFYRLNLHTGGTTGSAGGLAASLVPLYLGPTSRGVRFGNTIDSNIGPFTAADYSLTNGLFAGNSSGKYLDTGLASNTMPQSVYQAMHLSAWHGNVAYAGTDPCLIGAYNLTTDRAEIHISLRATPVSDDARLGQTAQVFTTTQLSGERNPASYIASRTSPTSLRLYRNGAFESETTTSVTSPGNSYPLYVHRRNGTGTPSGEQTGMSIWAYSIGAGMTPQQVTDYYNAMTAFNTAMGRNLLVLPQVANADAQSWINRVYNAGGTVSSSTAAAVNQFAAEIESAGLRDRFYRLNLMCGGSSGTNAGLAACLVPLYRGIAAGTGANFLTRSTTRDGGSFSSAIWETIGSSPTPVKNGDVASPVGSLTATSVTYTATSGYSALRWSSNYAGGWTANATGTFSVWARKPVAGGASAVRLTTNNAAGWNTGVSQKFTLTTEWQRLSVTGNLSTGVDMFALIGTGDASGGFDADCVGTVELWRPQIEVGSTATAWQACQYGLALDANNGPFAPGDYTETGPNGGLLGNGTSKWLNTGLTVSDIGTAASGHMSAYHGLSSGANFNRYYMGANDATTSNRFYLGTDAFSTANVFGSYGATQNASQTLASQGHGPAGHRILSRETDSSLTHYHNGSVVATNATPIAPALSTAAFAVFAANRNATVDRFHNSWISAYSIGLGLNSSQASTYRSILQTFQTSLGRNV